MSIRAIRSDTEHLPCVVEVIGADIYNLALTGDKACSLTSEGWTSTGTCPKVLILDHHPNDSRTDIAEDQQAVQTLTSRMGTGGGNVPLIAEPITYDAQVTNPLHKDNAEGGVCHTLNSDSRNYVVIPLEGNGARPSHHGDGYRKSGPMYSLNTTEVHGVAYSTQLCGDRDNPSVSVLEEKAFCIPANPMSDRGQSVAYAFEPGILKREGKENRVCEEVTPTIREHMGDNQTAVAYTVDMGGGKSSVCTYQEQSPTLACTHYGEPAVAYTLKIRGGCDTYMKWDGKQGTAGKGALIQIEKSATLAASQDQYLFQPIDNTK